MDLSNLKDESDLEFIERILPATGFVCAQPVVNTDVHKIMIYKKCFFKSFSGIIF